MVIFQKRYGLKKNISYSYLKVFECKAYMHVPEERSKLHEKVLPRIFLGYADEKFGHKLWDLEKKKLLEAEMLSL